MGDEWRRRWTLPRIRAFVLVLVVGLLVGGVLLLTVAATQPTSATQSVWFTAIGAGLALAALLGVGVTIYFALPSYHETFVARPAPRVRFQFPGTGGRWHDAEQDSVTVVDGTFETRVHVQNDGDAVLRWGILNIQVPIDCRIEVVDERPERVHYRASTPFDSGELFPGETVPCNATVAERDFPPVHSFTYVVRVTVPTTGKWPLAAVLDGYPAVRGWTRVHVEVHSAE